LTHTQGDESTPSWSPDSKWLVAELLPPAAVVVTTPGSLIDPSGEPIVALYPHPDTLRENPINLALAIGSTPTGQAPPLI
jgi:Tol biopolymer transport system component